ncbi:MAG: hypothetical protein A3A33_04895 [Candidatus Yanofskybacteria bacterium RIFCSPLOWO2_01_FULL_49_25]|uniref:Uncharacterized protein n=1 Tax=Candidatus Yanofskybacteria bacterium RIFCSPLOWO2_01_FULL_49_25 TaxID=1802701 RepID=A0A1F8GSV3_9BACT|nr:MAG: hypothetical protein A3A33_04895 [Candidatus Yanofskybacteria bacterium RIFCSPLOWO2_01_FULL_49_25]
MPIEQPSTPDRRKSRREIFEKFNVIKKVTERGPNFGDMLRTFEDRMHEGQSVAVFNYGSNSPEEFGNLFRQNGIDAKFGFGGQVQLEGGSLEFGSKSKARECPVATIKGGNGNVLGWLALVSKGQFVCIAKKECGDSLGRVKGKGRYRRGVIYLDDPRNPGEEMQSVTFVLNEAHSDLQQHPIGPTDAQKLTTEEKQKFDEYLRLISKQRQQSSMRQGEAFGEAPVEAHWNSRSVRGQ